MQGKVSYGIGNDPSKHADNLNTYERVNLGDMYPGVNVQLRASGNNVEKIFTVAANHDPQQIHIRIKGAEKLEIGDQGELIAHTGNGPVAFTAPIAFQDAANGERVAVAVAYQLDAGRERYGFTVGPYDRALPLTIDPLLQSSYLGGTGGDLAQALAIHPASGEVYVAGSTDSTDLPGVAGGPQAVKSTVSDAFVSRFNAALTMRLQSSYLGGTGDDFANALAIHPASGEVYVAGSTFSTDLPGVAGGAQAVKSTGWAAFVSRFNAALTTRLQSSYLGGTGDDFAYALAIHPASGEIYVAGSTVSTDLPGVAAGAQAVKSSGLDAFVSRLTPDLSVSDQTPNPFAFATQGNVPLATVRTSNPAQISGMVGATTLYVDGALGSSYCISSVANCSCDVSGGFLSTVTTITNNSYVCLRHVSASIVDEVVRSKLHVGGAAASFTSTTGGALNTCSLDIDGNGSINPLSDGLMLVRAMLGFTGTAVTVGAISGSPPRNTWALIQPYLNGNCGTSFLP